MWFYLKMIMTDIKKKRKKSHLLSEFFFLKNNNHLLIDWNLRSWGLTRINFKHALECEIKIIDTQMHACFNTSLVIILYKLAAKLVHAPRRFLFRITFSLVATPFHFVLFKRKLCARELSVLRSSREEINNRITLWFKKS